MNVVTVNYTPQYIPDSKSQNEGIPQYVPTPIRQTMDKNLNFSTATDTRSSTVNQLQLKRYYYRLINKEFSYSANGGLNDAMCALDLYGFVILTDAVDSGFCDQCQHSNLEMLMKLSENRLETTTSVEAKHLPPQSMPWTFKSFITNSQWLWDVRTHPNVLRVFKSLLCQADFQHPDLVAKSDGFCHVPPGGAGKLSYLPTMPPKQRTDTSMQRYNLQGQLLLTDSDGIFHLEASSELVKHMHKKAKSNSPLLWIRRPSLRAFLPICAPKGSLVLWKDNNKAAFQYWNTEILGQMPDDRFHYLSAFLAYRTLNTLSANERQQRRRAFLQNCPTGEDICSRLSNGHITNFNFYQQDSLLSCLNSGKLSSAEVYKLIEPSYVFNQEDRCLACLDG